jgi:hypothetical protein
MARKTREIISLPCVLTEEDILRYTKDRSEHYGKMKAAQNTLDAYKKQVNSEIATHEAKIDLLEGKLSSGKEFRDIECDIVYDWKKQVKIWVRKDTGEHVKDDIITEYECQEQAKLESENA